jgi:Uma2 family endonuclease
MEVTELGQLDLNKLYSYADYYSWKLIERVELIKGRIMRMSPAPSRLHQTLLRKIGTKIINYLENTTCQVYYAPFDVRLDRNQEDHKVKNVVQPDICVVCDLSKLDDRGCNGAPELVIEILSPGNTSKEMKFKFELYETAGVLEYWIVDPTEKIIWQYVLLNEKFTNHKPLIVEDEIESHVIKGLIISLTDIFKAL